jgi:hypothetical protein
LSRHDLSTAPPLVNDQDSSIAASARTITATKISA